MTKTNSRADLPNVKVIRPYAEYEKAQSLIFSGTSYFAAEAIKMAIIKNLPADVSLYVTYRSFDYNTIDEYKTVNPLLDLKTIDISRTGGNDFWERDGVPIPVFVENASGKEELGLVDAKYYHNYEPDQIFSETFNAPLISHEYYYEGGNFVADTKARCLTIDNDRVQDMPESIFKNYYGCKEIVRFPHVDGIGHVDERIKLLSDTVAVTDTPSYVEKLKSMGFKVDLLPKPKLEYGTYANSLLINGTLFLPIMNEATDATAIAIYKNHGLKVVPIDASKLVKGLGSIHCITMTYPAAN